MLIKLLKHAEASEYKTALEEISKENKITLKRLESETVVAEAGNMKLIAKLPKISDYSNIKLSIHENLFEIDLGNGTRIMKHYCDMVFLKFLNNTLEFQ